MTEGNTIKYYVHNEELFNIINGEAFIDGV